jgi:hypothetical protein
MHSLILQVSDKPIPEDKLLPEDHYNKEGMLPDFADYVDATSRKDALEWVAAAYADYVEVDVNAATVTVTDHKSLQIARLAEIQEAAVRLASHATIALTRTANNLSGAETATRQLDSDAYKLRVAMSDQGGFWIDHDYYGQETFVRWLAQARDGQVLHIGSTFDYHS